MTNFSRRGELGVESSSADFLPENERSSFENFEILLKKKNQVEVKQFDFNRLLSQAFRFFF